jgi:hypothetical protein
MVMSEHNGTRTAHEPATSGVTGQKTPISIEDDILEFANPLAIRGKCHIAS